MQRTTSRRSALLAALLVATTLVTASVAGAANLLNPAPAPGSVTARSTWVTNGTVNAIAVSGTTAYVGGNFTHVGPPTGGGVALDPTNPLDVHGAVSSRWPMVAGRVLATARDGAGTGMFIGGSFALVGTQQRGNLAHVGDDGTVDLTWAPTVDGAVTELARVGSTLYVGGSFETVAGQARSNLAAVDTTTGNATTWDPSPNNAVTALAASASAVYVGGGFSTIGGQSRDRIAALDTGTGLADPAWNPGADGDVAAIVLSGSSLFVGGAFTSIGGHVHGRIALLDSGSGVDDPAWDPDANSNVSALVLSGTTLYAGGIFTTIGVQPRNRIAAVDATTGNATTWDPDANGEVSALAIAGTTLYAGGSFTTIGGQARNRVAALDTTTGNATTWNPNADNRVDTIAYVASPVPTVFAGGSFGSVGTSGKDRRSLAAIDLTTGQADATWDPSPNGVISALATSGTTLYAGGSYTTVGGQPRNRLAAIDTGTGLADPTWNPSPDNSISALAVSGTTLYAGGAFTSVNGGTSRRLLAAFPTTGTGTATTWNPDVTGTNVNALALSGSTVYAGGSFTSVNGGTTPRNLLAAFPATGTGAADPTWNPGVTGTTVVALLAAGSRLYVGGTFTAVGGQSRVSLAALDATGTGAADASWNPSLNSGASVLALALSGTTLFAGGGFGSVGGQRRDRLAAIDTATGTPGAWNPSVDGKVNALALTGSGDLVAGGISYVVGNRPQVNFAVLPPPTVTTTTTTAAPVGVPLISTTTTSTTSTTVPASTTPTAPTTIPPPMPKVGDPGTRGGKSAELDEHTRDGDTSLTDALADSKLDGTFTPDGNVTLSCDRDCGTPGATADVTAYSNPIALTKVKVDADGGYTASVTLPTLAEGEHHLVVMTKKAGKVVYYGNPVWIVEQPDLRRATACTNPTSCRSYYKGAPFTGPLKRGSKGASVTILQETLGLPVTKTYDAATEKAVKALQAWSRSPVTGVVDEKLWKAIFGSIS